MKLVQSITFAAAVLISVTPVSALQSASSSCKAPEFIEIQTKERARLLVAASKIIKVYPTSGGGGARAQIVVDLGDATETLDSYERYSVVKEKLCGVNLSFS